MTGRTPDLYFESAVLSADPVELTAMLYEAAVAAVEDARRHLANGDIASRSRAISRAHEILSELVSSLNHDPGEEFSRRLAGLYDYIMRLLLDANLRQVDPPLAEARQLLGTLADGWRQMQTSQRAASEPAVPVEKEPDPVGASPWPGGYGVERYSESHSWSL